MWIEKTRLAHISHILGAAQPIHTYTYLHTYLPTYIHTYPLLLGQIRPIERPAGSSQIYIYRYILARERAYPSHRHMTHILYIQRTNIYTMREKGERRGTEGESSSGSLTIYNISGQQQVGRQVDRIHDDAIRADAKEEQEDDNDDVCYLGTADIYQSLSISIYLSTHPHMYQVYHI